MNTIYRKDRRMIRATTEYHLWSEVPYKSQLRIIRALASITREHAKYIHLHDCKKYDISSIYECVDKELDAYKGKD